MYEWIQQQICRWSCFPPPSCQEDEALARIVNRCFHPNSNDPISNPHRVNLTLTIVHDQFPAETAILWEHMESATQLLFQNYEDQPATIPSNHTDEGSGDHDPIVVNITKRNQPNGTYHLLIADSARDGMYVWIFC